MAFICIWVLYRAHFHHFAFMIRKTKFKACYLLIYYHDKTKTVKGIHFVFSIILNLVHYSLHSSEITKIINWFTFAGAKIKAFEIKHHFLFDLCCGSTRKRTNVLNVFPTFYFRLNELWVDLLKICLFYLPSIKVIVLQSLFFVSDFFWISRFANEKCLSFPSTMHLTFMFDSCQPLHFFVSRHSIIGLNVAVFFIYI